MLRKLIFLYEQVFGKSELPQDIPIPKENPVIYVPVHEAEAYHQRLTDCIELLTSEFQLETCHGLQGHLRSFAPPGHPQQMSPLHSFRLRQESSECYWLSFAFQETIREGKGLYEVNTIRQATIVDAPFNVGHAFIRPENIPDKVAELFGPVDIDFRRESQFSRKYFVLAEDEQKVRNNLPRSFMQLLEKEPGLFVRFCENQVLLARDRGLRAQDALQLAEVAFAAAKCL